MDSRPQTLKGIENLMDSRPQTLKIIENLNGFQALGLESH